MDMLNIIKMTSLIIMGLSYVLLFIAIGQRAIHYYFGPQEAKRRERLYNDIFAYFQGTMTCEAIKQSLQKNDPRCLAEHTRDLYKKIQGKDREGLTELLVFLEIPDQIAAIALQGRLGERLEAIANLEHFTDPRVVTFLHKLLDDPVHDVRLAAARTLIESDSLSSVDLLFEKLDLSLGPQAIVLHNVFRRLKADAAPRLLEILSTASLSQHADTIKVLIMEALGHLRYTEGASMLTLAEDPSFQVRLAFFRCLRGFWIPSALPMLFKGLEDSHWQVRAQAAWCAGQLHLIDAIPRLAHLVETETEWESQYAASSALVAIGEKGITALQALAQGTSQGKGMAEKVLLENGKVPLLDNGIPATFSSTMGYQFKTYSEQEQESYVWER